MVGVLLSLTTFALAQGGARIAARRGLIGGGIIIAMLLTGGASLLSGGIPLPIGVDVALFCLTGVLIGAEVDRQNLIALRSVALPAVLSAALLILAGVAIAAILEVLGIAPEGALLATSPGGLHVMVAAAIENDLDAPRIALFHVARLFLIVLSIPLLLRLLPGPVPRARGGAIPLSRDALGTADPAAVADVPGGRGGLAVTALAGGIAGSLAALTFGSGSSLAVLSTAVLGSAAANLAWPAGRPLPRLRRSPGLFVQAGIGWLIGRLITLETLTGLGPVLVGALVAGGLSVLSGVLVAYTLRLVRLQPGSDMLATAPGAVEVLPLLDDPRNDAPVVVTLFHFVRVLLVLAAVPLLIALSISG